MSEPKWKCDLCARLEDKPDDYVCPVVELCIDNSLYLPLLASQPAPALSEDIIMTALSALTSEQEYKELRAPAISALVALRAALASERAKREGVYSIEPHGDAWVLYVGRDSMHHGANLCRLSEFDARGEETRSHIVRALNARPVPDASALREALTPSAETKAAYIGEFKFTIPAQDEDGNEVTREIDVPWTTIKEIMTAIEARALLRSEPREESR